MKFFTGCVAAATLVLAVSAADAQVLVRSPYVAASDFDGPYGPPGPPPPPPRQGYGYGYGSSYGYEQAPGLLPATEVYAVLRENGFSPLGIPRLRGTVYTITVIDRRGDDGRLVIDARDGRILRFVPAYGAEPAYEEGALAPYGAQAALPPPTAIRSAVPRPPAPVPHVASRSVPLPKAAPHRGETPVAVAPAAVAKPVVSEPAPQAQPAQPAQQTAATQAKPAESARQAAAPTVGQAKPAPTILPTQGMPAAQGLD
ncbi:hypothetical protein JQ596_25670 [Bradyrhizobium manausense]|uniref:hypothetical protein n=1 Tax=Bradyrhizobium TaxID=374 RepID=UPI001BAC15DA|nr:MULTISPECIES: hypothetical protein [Bradyrhizobium]MBR0828928.1 hypothetical protein [Bradyrhizobium manausense]UVO28066.1 hypothetical protein KUF59_37270 [Bradyrhizobium arachidis]